MLCSPARGGLDFRIIPGGVYHALLGFKSLQLEFLMGFTLLST